MSGAAARTGNLQEKDKKNQQKRAVWRCVENNKRGISTRRYDTEEYRNVQQTPIRNRQLGRLIIKYICEGSLR